LVGGPREFEADCRLIDGELARSDGKPLVA